MLLQFLAKPKLGGDQLISTFQHKIDADIEEKFNSFKQENEKKRTNFIVSVQSIRKLNFLWVLNGGSHFSCTEFGFFSSFHSLFYHSSKINSGYCAQVLKMTHSDSKFYQRSIKEAIVIFKIKFHLNYSKRNDQI